MLLLDQLLCSNLGEQSNFNFCLLLLICSPQEQQQPAPSHPFLLVDFAVLLWGFLPQTPPEIQLPQDYLELF